MMTSAVNHYFRSSIGRKHLVAITGLLLCGWRVATHSEFDIPLVRAQCEQIGDDVLDLLCGQDRARLP